MIYFWKSPRDMIYCVLMLDSDISQYKKEYDSKAKSKTGQRRLGMFRRKLNYV